MSMNPARTFGSAFHASYWHALWLYFIAPTLGMLVAAEAFLRARSGVGPYCAKLCHTNVQRCIFHFGYRPAGTQNFCVDRRYGDEKTDLAHSHRLSANPRVCR